MSTFGARIGNYQNLETIEDTIIANQSCKKYNDEEIPRSSILILPQVGAYGLETTNLPINDKIVIAPRLL